MSQVFGPSKNSDTRTCHSIYLYSYTYLLFITTRETSTLANIYLRLKVLTADLLSLRKDACGEWTNEMNELKWYLVLQSRRPCRSLVACWAVLESHAFHTWHASSILLSHMTCLGTLQCIKIPRRMALIYKCKHWTLEREVRKPPLDNVHLIWSITLNNI